MYETNGFVNTTQLSVVKILMLILPLFNYSCSINQEIAGDYVANAAKSPKISPRVLPTPGSNFTAYYSYYDDYRFLGDYRVRYSQPFNFNNETVFAATTILEDSVTTRLFRQQDYAFIGQIVNHKLVQHAKPYQVMFHPEQNEHQYLWIDYSNKRRLAVQQHIGEVKLGLISLNLKTETSLSQEIRFKAQQEDWTQKTVWLIDYGIIYHQEIINPSKRETHALIDIKMD